MEKVIRATPENMLTAVPDNSSQEIKNHGNADFQFEYYYDDMRKINSRYESGHWHMDFEFSTIDVEQTECVIGTERIKLEKGNGLFINSGVIHRFEAPKGGYMPIILFAPEFIAEKDTAIYQNNIMPVMSSSCNYIIFSEKNDWQRGIIDTLSEIYEEALSTHHSLMQLRIHNLVCSLWINMFNNKQDAFSNSYESGSALMQSRLHLMIRYIREYYPNKITLENIAGAANVSKSEALRCFRSGLQSTPVKYLIEYRLKRARELLLSTDLSVTGISIEVGFGSVSYFTHLFTKTYGMSPREFRRISSR